MELQISDQAAAFSGGLLLGAALGLVYDLLRCLRACRGRWGTALADALYCLTVLTAVFYFAMAFGRGLLRIYMVLGVVAGAVLFFCFFSRPLRPLWDYWRDSLAAALGILLAPVRFFLGLAKIFGKK